MGSGYSKASSSQSKILEYAREVQRLERQIKSLRTRSIKYEANKNYNLNKEDASKSAKKLDEINDKIKSLDEKRIEYLKRLNKAKKRQTKILGTSVNDDELPF